MASSVRPSRDLVAFLGPTTDWARIAACVKGPLITLAAAVLLDVLRRHGAGIVAPLPILFLAIVYSAFVAGLRPALVSVAIVVLYALHYFSQTGLPLRYTPGGAANLVAVAGAAVLAAVLVSRMHERLRGADALRRERADAEGLARRFGMLEQAALVLTSAREPEVAFRDFARLLVPLLGDWCTIHVAPEGGSLRFVAGAHRDPSRDLVVRALADYGERGLPFGPPPGDPRVVAVTDTMLREAAADGEHLKLYRALAPAEVLRLPLGAPLLRGVVTLVMASDSGRRFAPADVALAEELAEAAALAIENVRLRGEMQDVERRARLVFEANPQPMWLFDVDTLAFLAVNDAAIRHYGYSREEFLGMTIMELLAPEDIPPMAGHHESPRAGVAIAQHQRRDGTLIEMELASHEVEIDGRRARLVLAADLTERGRVRAALQRSEEQLRQAQRSEALGRVARGVGHDFNNLLTTIRGFGEMLLADLPERDRRRHDVQRICQAAERGALLTRQLLSFGQTRAQEPRPVSLNDVVRDLEPLVRRLAGADVTVDVRLDEAAGQVLADPAQLEHLLVNLVLGTRDAMPAGGRLTIETADRRIRGAGPGRPLRPGRYVVLAVRDSGTGEEVAPRELLGRSIVYGIVRQYGGIVRVASEAGRGTVVKVYLPRLEVEDVPEPDAAETWRGTETVLVAEDEDGVRELARDVLTGFGYTVLAARHGRDALQMAGEGATGVDLLLTDVVMPEMSGRELAEHLRERRPDLKVLYMSGYTDDEVLRRGISEREVTFLHKPFAAEELARRVRGLLDGGP